MLTVGSSCVRSYEVFYSPPIKLRKRQHHSPSPSLAPNFSFLTGQEIVFLCLSAALQLELARFVFCPMTHILK